MFQTFHADLSTATKRSVGQALRYANLKKTQDEPKQLSNALRKKRTRKSPKKRKPPKSQQEVSQVLALSEAISDRIDSFCPRDDYEASTELQALLTSHDIRRADFLKAALCGLYGLEPPEALTKSEKAMELYNRTLSLKPLYYDSAISGVGTDPLSMTSEPATELIKGTNRTGEIIREDDNYTRGTKSSFSFRDWLKDMTSSGSIVSQATKSSFSLSKWLKGNFAKSVQPRDGNNGPNDCVTASPQDGTEFPVMNLDWVDRLLEATNSRVVYNRCS